MIDYDEAALYLKQRLEIEKRATDKINGIIINSFKDLVALTFPCSLTAQNFKLDLLPNKEDAYQILKEMRSQIYLTVVEYCEQAAQSRKEMYDLPNYPFSVDNILSAGEQSAHDKCYTYSRRLTKEFETWLALGLFYGWGASKIISTFSSNISTLYSNNFFIKASASAKFNTTRLRNGGVSYGVGRYKSAVNSLNRLTRGSIGATVKSIDFGLMKRKGIVGFHVYRGSTYPCSLCDSMVGFHPLSVGDLPPYHPHCCCFAVPI